MSFTVQMRVKGQDIIKRRIDTIGKLPKDLSVEFKKCGQILRAEWLSYFDKQGSEKGAWSELAPYTKAKRASMGYPPDRPIGVNTGDFKRSIAGKGAQTVEKVEKNYAAFGISGYGAIFHSGRKARGFQPARDIISLSQKAKTAVMKVFHEAVKKVTR